MHNFLKHFFSLVFVCFLLAACATVAGPDVYSHNPAPRGIVTRVVPVWIDKDFSLSHRAAIHDAISTWNSTLNGYERFEVVSDEYQMEVSVIRQIVNSMQGLLILQRHSDDPIMDQFEQDGVLAWVVRQEGDEGHLMNIVADAIGNRDLKAITMHELGHTLGLPHLPVKNTLLYPSYTYGSSCIDQVTVQALASLRGWDWHHMNACTRPA